MPSHIELNDSIESTALKYGDHFTRTNCVVPFEAK